MCKFQNPFSLRVFGEGIIWFAHHTKINLGRLVMFTKPFFSYLNFCFGGWFSELRKRARNPTPPPPSGFCFFFLTSLQCERVTTVRRDWVGGWMVGVVGWWAFGGLSRTEGAWESRCFLWDQKWRKSLSISWGIKQQQLSFSSQTSSEKHHQIPHLHCPIPFIQIPIPISP
jgi:hypothetical protein